MTILLPDLVEWKPRAQGAHWQKQGKESPRPAAGSYSSTVAVTKAHKPFTHQFRYRCKHTNSYLAMRIETESNTIIQYICQCAMASGTLLPQAGAFTTWHWHTVG